MTTPAYLGPWLDREKLWSLLKEPELDAARLAPMIELLAREDIIARRPFLWLLLRCLNRSHPLELRLAAVRALAGAAGAKAWPHLVEALHDPEPAIREAARDSLWSACHEDPAKWIHVLIHPDPAMRASGWRDLPLGFPKGVAAALLGDTANRDAILQTVAREAFHGTPCWPILKAHEAGQIDPETAGRILADMPWDGPVAEILDGDSSRQYPSLSALEDAERREALWHQVGSDDSDLDHDPLVRVIRLLWTRFECLGPAPSHGTLAHRMLRSRMVGSDGERPRWWFNPPLLHRTRAAVAHVAMGLGAWPPAVLGYCVESFPELLADGRVPVAERAELARVVGTRQAGSPGTPTLPGPLLASAIGSLLPSSAECPDLLVLAGCLRFATRMEQRTWLRRIAQRPGFSRGASAQPAGVAHLLPIMHPGDRGFVFAQLTPAAEKSVLGALGTRLLSAPRAVIPALDGLALETQAALLIHLLDRLAEPPAGTTCEGTQELLAEMQRLLAARLRRDLDDPRSDLYTMIMMLAATHPEAVGWVIQNQPVTLHATASSRELLVLALANQLERCTRGIKASSEGDLPLEPPPIHVLSDDLIDWAAGDDVRLEKELRRCVRWPTRRVTALVRTMLDRLEGQSLEKHDEEAMLALLFCQDDPVEIMETFSCFPRRFLAVNLMAVQLATDRLMPRAGHWLGWGDLIPVPALVLLAVGTRDLRAAFAKRTIAVPDGGTGRLRALFQGRVDPVLQIVLLGVSLGVRGIKQELQGEPTLTAGLKELEALALQLLAWDAQPSVAEPRLSISEAARNVLRGSRTRNYLHPIDLLGYDGVTRLATTRSAVPEHVAAKIRRQLTFGRGVLPPRGEWDVEAALRGLAHGTPAHQLIATLSRGDQDQLRALLEYLVESLAGCLAIEDALLRIRHPGVIEDLFGAIAFLDPLPEALLRQLIESDRSSSQVSFLASIPLLRHDDGAAWAATVEALDAPDADAWINDQTEAVLKTVARGDTERLRDLLRVQHVAVAALALEELFKVTTGGMHLFSLSHFVTRGLPHSTGVLGRAVRHLVGHGWKVPIPFRMEAIGSPSAGDVLGGSSHSLLFVEVLPDDAVAAIRGGAVGGGSYLAAVASTKLKPWWEDSLDAPGVSRELQARVLDAIVDSETDFGVLKAAVARLRTIDHHRSEVARRLGQLLEWTDATSLELDGRRFEVEWLTSPDLGFTWARERRIWINPLPLLRGERDGRTLVEALVVHEIGHHLYHFDRAGLKVAEQANRDGLHPLLNLVQDEHLERRIRRRWPAHGERLRTLAAYAFQHMDRDLAIAALAERLGPVTFALLSRSRVKASPRTGCVRVSTGSLLRAAAAEGNSFARFARALALGLGNRDNDPKVERALALFGRGFADLGADGLLEITYQLHNIFRDEIRIIEALHLNLRMVETEEERLRETRGVTPEEARASLRRQRWAVPAPAPWRRPPPDIGFKPIKVREALPYNPAAARRLAAEVRAPSRAIRALLATLATEPVRVGRSPRGARLDRNELAQRMLIEDPRILQVRRVRPGAGFFLGLLVDCSGSMTGKKHERAKRFAAMVAEACGPLHQAECRILGFSDDKLFDAGDARRPAVHAMQANGGTNDAGALWAMANLAMQSARPRRLIVMISDGQPTECSVEALQALVRKVTRRMGIATMQVAVEPLEVICFPHHVLITDATDAGAVHAFRRALTGAVRRTTGRG